MYRVDMSKREYARAPLPVCRTPSATVCSVPSGQEATPSNATVRGLGQIEYRLARDSAVRDVRRGRRSRGEVCDAQPELLRVAQNLGQWTATDCPICEDAKLVNVAFAFGPRLPP